MDGEKGSRLLSIPPELRLLIYEFVWVPLSALVHPKTYTLPQTVLPTPQSLSLLLVCRQIHAEALRIAWSSHTFTVNRDLTTQPLHHEPRLYPHSLITSLLIPGYRRDSPAPSPPSSSSTCPFMFEPSPAPDSAHSRCYNFKELCTLVRRFKNLSTIVIVTEASEMSRFIRGLKSRQAHVHFRMKKARHFKDDRFMPSYDLKGLHNAEIGSSRAYRLTIAVGDGIVREADLLLCGLDEVGRLREVVA